jgi:YidC/Oxa1 family membrane protein insertase
MGRRLPLPVLLLGACALLGPVAAVAGDGERVRVATSRLEVVLALAGGDPVAWRACHPSCAAADAGRGSSMRFAAEGEPPALRVILPGSETLGFTAELGETERARVATLQAELPGGARLVKSFEVSKEGYEVVMTARLVGRDAGALASDRRLEVTLAPGPGMLPPPAPGFAAMLERVDRVVVAGGAARSVDAATTTPLRAGDWAGFRGRFWTMVARPDQPATLTPRPGAAVALSAPPSEPATAWRYTIYSGPLEQSALARAEPPLEPMLLSGLWPGLRALSLGMLWLLHGLTALIGHPAVAIIGLAVCVKALLLPLTRVADRLQEQVNATQARLQPGLDAIRAEHRGEERTRRTLALYREAGVHPLYTLKSLLGFLIQIPVFIAVFDMLAEDFDLYRVPFLWIADLSRPDELARLPACLPFFGCHLNLLPFLMSGASLAALLRFRSPVLTPALVRRQRLNLAGMTALFFLLFYTFPAGMVLYWTSTNTVQLAIGEVRRRRAGS